MSRAKVARSSLLSGLVDSDSEDGLNDDAFHVARPTAPAKFAGKQRATDAMPPATKGARGRQAANKVTKPAQQKKTSTRQLAAALEKASDDETRTALVEKSSNAQPKATARGRKKAVAAPEKEDDDVVMEDAPEEPAAKPKTTRGRPKKAAAVDEAKEVAKPAQRAPAGRGRAAKKVEVVMPEEEDMTEIPETQQPPGAYPAGSETDEERGQLVELPASDLVEKNRHIPSSPSKRPLYSSSSEAGGGDPALRRRLGDMTQKYESLEKRYLYLKEVAVREAERNFDRLKKQTDEKAKAAEQLIATLKSEVAAQKEEAKEAIRLKKQLDETTTHAEDLQTRVASLTTSLAEAKTEIKSLTMKLSAARSAEASAVARVVPSSAIKGGHAQQAQRQEQATLSAQLKEDLYGDLTGLIVRGVKRDGAEDVYDCIQTGRNGTLHFKLAIEAEPAENFDDTQFAYMPQLDPNRDARLIDILPDFLADEITFPRPQAAKFYARVMKALCE